MNRVPLSDGAAATLAELAKYHGRTQRERLPPIQKEGHRIIVFEVVLECRRGRHTLAESAPTPGPPTTPAALRS